ncbi:MAG TPA: hypothetical protein VGG07_19650 [Solirubrobacteraceae bacterium]
MRSIRLGVGVVVAVAALSGPAIAAPSTAPKPRDVAAARPVVNALVRFDQAALARQSAVMAAAKAAVAQVQAGCAAAIPKAAQHGTGTQQSVVQDVLVEGALDVSLAANHPLAAPLRQVATRLAAAHFSSPALTRGFQNTARANRLVLSLTPTDLCADVKAAAAAGFAADPPGTTAALKRIARLSSAHGLGLSLIPSKLAPYLVTARDRGALAHLKTLNARYVTAIQGGELTWERKLGSALDK